MSTIDKKELLAAVKRAKKKIAAERDFLQTLRNDITDIEESSDEALNSLDDAIAALSKYL